jgi:peroxiredoxin
MAVHSSTASMGAAAPDFQLADQDGVTFHLAGALARGPVVLIFLRGFT